MHTDFEAEKRYLDYAHTVLEGQIADSNSSPAVGGDRIVRRGLRDLASQRTPLLEEARAELYFGRLDFEKDDERVYLGKTDVPDIRGMRLVVMSWRAPAAEKWYLASPSSPQGLRNKRHLKVSFRDLLDVRDEPMGRPELEGSSLDSILEELSRSRNLQMGDIVATIQSEQYRLVSQQLDGILAIQGGPGTGKTAVALHRAAWVYYNFRNKMAAGVLIVGPNQAFMEYISTVLPSLGERTVQQRAIARIDTNLPSRTRPEPRAIARLKGDPRMVSVISRFLEGAIHMPVHDLVVTLSGSEVVVPAQSVLNVVQKVRRRGVPFNESRRFFRNQIEREAHRILLAPPLADGEPRGSRHNATGLGDFDIFRDELRKDEQWTAYVAAVWPRLSPEMVINKVLGNAHPYAAGKLSDDECRSLRKARRKKQEDWTVADLALLDEAKHQLDGIKEGFDHVVVDEVQDLSPLQLRAIGRRARGGSITLAGDLAQSTGPWVYSSWDEIIEAMAVDAPARFAELTVSYRVPSQIMELAVGLLPLMASGLEPNVRAIRRGETAPTFVQVEEGAIPGTVATEVKKLEARWSGTIAVIAPADQLPKLHGSLDSEGIAGGLIVEDGLSSRVTLLSPEHAKGLEFDAVVLVEPAALEEVGTLGISELYVSITRATQHLSVVYSRDSTVTLR